MCHFLIFHSNWNHCCVFLLSFYHQDILSTQTESLYEWHCVDISFEVRWIWSRAGMHWHVALLKIYLFNMSDGIISSPAEFNHWNLLKPICFNSFVSNLIQNIDDQEVHSWIISTLKRDLILINMNNHILEVSTTIL